MPLPALNTKGIDITAGLDRMQRTKAAREQSVIRGKQNALLDLRLSPEAIKADKSMKNALLKEQQIKNKSNGARAIRDNLGIFYQATYNPDPSRLVEMYEKGITNPIFGEQTKAMTPDPKKYIKKTIGENGEVINTITKEDQRKLRRLYKGLMVQAGKVANRGVPDYVQYTKGDGTPGFIPLSALAEENADGSYDNSTLRMLTNDPSAKFITKVKSDDKTVVKVKGKDGKLYYKKRSELTSDDEAPGIKPSPGAKYSKILQNQFGEMRILMNDGSVKKVENGKTVKVTKDDKEDANKYIPFEGQPSAVEQMLMQSMGGEFAKGKFEDRPAKPFEKGVDSTEEEIKVMEVGDTFTYKGKKYTKK